MIILLPMIGKAQMFDCERGGGYFKVIAESGLNIREEPNLSSNKVAKIPNGSMVFCCQYYENCKEETIEGKKGIWKKVFFDKYEGFVFSGFLEPENDIQVLCPFDWVSETNEPAFKKELTYFGIYEDKQFREQSIAKIYNGKDTTYEHGAIGMVRGIKVEKGNVPNFIVSGIELKDNQIVKGVHLNSKMLYPGESIRFGESYIYALGEPELNEETYLQPFKSIGNYKLIIREKLPNSEKFREEVLFDTGLPAWGGGQYEGGAYIRWIGDIDGDNRLDVLLTFATHFACYNVILFLSTKAIGKRLVGEAASYGVCGC
jgi:hypothetical protein